MLSWASMTTPQVRYSSGCSDNNISTTCTSNSHNTRHFMSSLAAAVEDEEDHAPREQEQDLKMVLILGKPGGGKGTISGKILRDFPTFRHLSTGDLLRQHVRHQTDLGQQAKAYMDKGALVPDHLMINLVLHDATRGVEGQRSDHHHQDGYNSAATSSSLCLLLDGFPRNVVQAQALEQQVTVNWVVNLNVPTETIVERIADRWIHPASGRVYSYSYKPPLKHGVDDVTGEPLVQRDDDQPDTVRKRLAAYDEVTAPLVDYYQEKGVLQTFTGMESDVLYPQVKCWLEHRGF